ncbi:transcription-repair coupling factor [Georgenia sp. Z1344]|uniref:transcription-repair coupling factor n=1 Tax=Georgenia sp. Z1344 TaxID=3416706 RepID=UPI003CEDD4CC
MSLTGLLPLLREDPAIAALVAAASAPVLEPHRATTAPVGVRPALAAELAATDRPIVLVTATGRDADELATGVREFLPADEVATFPAWETLPHERLSPRSDTVAHRLATLRRLVHPGPEARTARPRVVTVPVRALLQPIVSGLADLEPVRVQVGDTIALDDLVRALEAAAYTRTDMVERRGEYAVRGGIVDVFPPTDPHPLRLELFGDDVEEIRRFSVADQRSLEVAEEGLWAPPCRELLLTPAVRERARSLIPTVPSAAPMLERISEGVAVEGMEALSPVLADGLEPLLDLLPERSLVVLVDPERIRRRAADLAATTEEFLAAAWTSAASGAEVPLDLRAAAFADLAEARALALAKGQGWWSVSSLPTDEGLEDATVVPGSAGSGGAPDGSGTPADDAADPGGSAARAAIAAASGPDDDPRTVAARETRRYRGDVDGALKDLAALVHDEWRILLTTQGAGPARRLRDSLAEADVPARLVTDLPEAPEPGLVTITHPGLDRGFVVDGQRLAVLTESDLTGRPGSSTREMRKMPARRRTAVDPLSLRPGDLVVHSQHGVGRFVELVSRTVGRGETATTREYLVIEYAPSKRGQPGDRLFAPTDSLDQVSRYVGGEAPALNKMGGSDWAAAKRKARKAVREIAGELVRLYAARQATVGHTFGPDTPWQRELEDAFPYTETPDQLSAIDEVKADMEKAMPMDRLISGDVGYGKTEIAVRAAFKAVQDGKQVAVLVPTTLLVNQHLDTFAERYAGFPVRVAALSRFQSPAEATEVREGLAAGSIDVVIGTHTLLTGQVRFKELGLVVIDEEQRFGVEHKETLTQLRTNVDVLAMSATPIPRTLEMAVTGIREMSTLATPPEERHPILTYVGAQEDKQVGAAIRRELLREGQVFYVHNKVRSINATAQHLAELVPEARIGVAHGQMNEHQLEAVIQDFWERSIDVLVCTTIIETGLDIANANTLIVERADTFGLSQLHQLRGRVGRGRERAYGYFLYDPDKPLTETAHDRLATIASHTELGAGIQVAMKDLELRGAGNLLGSDQSGHIEGVGFDMYVRMISEAVAAWRDGKVEPERVDVRVELPIDAHVPTEYVDTERLRLEVYAKIAAADDDEALDSVRAELVDRYGPVPPSVERLFAVARLRAHAREAGIQEITAQGKNVRFFPVELAESQSLRLTRVHRGTMLKPAVRTALVPWPLTQKVGGRPLADVDLLAWVEEVVALIGTPVGAPAGAWAGAGAGAGSGAAGA